MKKSLSILALLSLMIASHGSSVALAQIAPVRDLSPPGAGDIDDSAFWVHPIDPTLSTIILSDKGARKIFVVRPDGTVVQTLTVATSGNGPGNIDIRHAVHIGGEPMDLVVVTNRDTDRLNVYRVDQVDGTLTRIDDGAIDVTHARPVYGMGLYHSPISGKLFAIVTQDDGGRLEQIELVASGDQISGVQARTWEIDSLTEGVVVDDENGRLFYSEENIGVWGTSAEPDGDRPGARVAGMHVGENNLEDDLEGITIFHQSDGGGYLLVSSQGSDSFGVFERLPPHAHVGTFHLEGVAKTDGIDVTPVSLGGALDEGAMTAHNGISSPYSTVLVSWADIRAALPGITVSPSPAWDPRSHASGDGDGSGDAGSGSDEEPGEADGGVGGQPPALEPIQTGGCSAAPPGPAAPIGLLVLVLCVCWSAGKRRRCTAGVGN